MPDLAHVELCANHDLDGSRADLKCTGELVLGFSQQCPEVQLCRHLPTYMRRLEIELIDSYGQLGERCVVNRIAEPLPYVWVVGNVRVRADVDAIALLSALGADVGGPANTSDQER